MNGQQARRGHRDGKQAALWLVCTLGFFAAFGIRVQAQEQPFAHVVGAERHLNAVLAAAQPGDTITVPAGVYAGPLQIEKSLTLQAAGDAVIDGGGEGHVIAITAPDVTIRGFIIRNSGNSLDREHSGILAEASRVTIEDNRLEDVLFGLYLKNAPDSMLRGNTIYSKDLDIARRGDGIKVWYSARCLIDGNQVNGSRDVLVWYSPDCTVQGNIVENSRYGVHLMNSDDQTLADNVLRNNSVGAYVMYGHGILLQNNLIYANRGPSGYGIGLKDAVNVVMQDNRSVGNRVGLYIDNAPQDPDATVRFIGNMWAYNEIGVQLLPNVRRTVFTDNLFLENAEQVAVAGGGDVLANQWSFAGRGNYWSDYVGFDEDGDNIGDIPYRAQRLFEDLAQQHAALRLFQLSPTAAALDLAARAFPVFQPQPKLVDERPLVEPPLPAAAAAELPTAPVTANLAASLTMIALAVAILANGNITGAKAPRTINERVEA